MKVFDFGVEFFFGYIKVPELWRFSFIIEKNLPQYGKKKFSTKKILNFYFFDFRFWGCYFFAYIKGHIAQPKKIATVG
jgi:hypothetical protein